MKGGKQGGPKKIKELSEANTTEKGKAEGDGEIWKLHRAGSSTQGGGIPAQVKHPTP